MSVIIKLRAVLHFMLAHTDEVKGNKGILLRPLRASDAVEIAALANDPQIGSTLRDIFPYPYTVDDARRFVDFTSINKAFHCWGICRGETLTGVISIIRQDDVYRHSGEIGFWLGTNYHNQGIMTEAVNLACRYAFDELKFVRIFACVFEKNEASKSVLLKNGFNLEGIRKKAVLKNNVFLDDYMLAKVNL